MSSEMVERLTEVLFRRPSGDTEWDCRDTARAVLEAMCEPTDAMIKAGTDNYFISGERLERSDCEQLCVAVYRAMLTAALAEPTSPNPDGRDWRKMDDPPPMDGSVIEVLGSIQGIVRARDAFWSVEHNDWRLCENIDVPMKVVGWRPRSPA